MASSLRDIPGASGPPGRRRPRDPWQGVLDRSRPSLLSDPLQLLGQTSIGGRRRRGMLGRRFRLSPFDSLLVVAVLAVAVFLGRGLWSATRVDLTTSGIEHRDALTSAEARHLDVRLTMRPASGMESSRLTYDGRPLDDAVKSDDGYRWKPDRPLNAGVHRLELTVPRPVLPASRFVWEFTVDATPPRLETPRLLRPHGLRQPVHVAGRVDDPDVTLTASGEKVDVDDDGRFRIDYPRPPAGPIVLKAVDPAGHQVTREIFVPVKRPRVRGVHMSAISWRTGALRQGVFDLIDAGAIDAVELDLKDESGEIGYHSKVPLGMRIGAVKGYYDLRAAVKELHARGVRVIGRLVAFRDPVLATAAWEGGRHDDVVQRPDGTPHGAYGGFTNMASPAVEQYNLDIAAEAAAAGVDEVLWDYIRRPEGDLAGIVFPGMPSTDAAVENAVVGFLTRGHQLLRAKGVLQGASVFGVAAKNPASVGQNVPQIARHVDYLAPMVYPSLWVPGEYRVADPAGTPATIVARSLADFQAKSRGTGVNITPWLQDFSLGRVYGDEEVRAQVDAAASIGIDDFLLWSPRVRYHAGALATSRDGKTAR